MPALHVICFKLASDLYPCASFMHFINIFFGLEMHRYQGYSKRPVSRKKDSANMSLLEPPVQDSFLTTPAPPGKSPLFLQSLDSECLERRPTWRVCCHLPASELELETDSEGLEPLSFLLDGGGRQATAVTLAAGHGENSFTNWKLCADRVANIRWGLQMLEKI